MTAIKGRFVLDTPGTKDLHPPKLECEWSAEFEGDPDLEKALYEYTKRSFENEMRKVLEAQIKHMNVPLASMQKSVETFRAAAKVLYDAGDIREGSKAFEAFKQTHATIIEEHKSYDKYLSDMVKNINDQQLKIYSERFQAEAMAYAKKKIKRDVQLKKAKMIAKVVASGALAVAIVAGGVTATVLTFGAAGVAFATLGAISVGLGGVSTALSVGKSVFEIRDMEKRAVGLLKDDIQSVSEQLGRCEGQTSGLSKHIGDVSRYYSLRRAKTADLRKNMDRLAQEIDKLKPAVKGIAELAPKLSAAEEKKLAKLIALHKEATTKLEAAAHHDAEIKAVLQEAEKLVGDLKSMPFQESRSVVQRLKDLEASDVYDLVTDGISKVSELVGVASAYDLQK